MPKCDLLRHGCSSVDLLHIFRTPFLWRTPLGGCFRVCLSLTRKREVTENYLPIDQYVVDDTDRLVSLVDIWKKTFSLEDLGVYWAFTNHLQPFVVGSQIFIGHILFSYLIFLFGTSLISVLSHYKITILLRISFGKYSGLFF